MSQIQRFIPTSGPGSGTVTSISAGTGITLTPNPITSTGTVALTIPVSIADGGTNATSMTNTDGVVYFDGTRLVTTAVGTATYVLTSNGSGLAPTFQAAGGGGITTIDGDSGSATGSTVTISAQPETQGTARFVASGSSVLLQFDNGNNNLGLGAGTLAGNPSSGGNTCVGVGAGQSITGATGFNTAFGWNALASNTSSFTNTAVGAEALIGVTGPNNTALGYGAGASYTTGTNNISIGVDAGGTGSESRTLRIGAGTGSASDGELTQAFISGIQGISVTGAAVLVSSSDQLGVTVSSRRYKEEIFDMTSASDKILELRPVTFKYIGDDTPQTGLIAEEVAEVMPTLVVYDKFGDPQTVKYHELPALLLNELQKALKRIEVLEAREK